MSSQWVPLPEQETLNIPFQGHELTVRAEIATKRGSGRCAVCDAESSDGIRQVEIKEIISSGISLPLDDALGRAVILKVKRRLRHRKIVCLKCEDEQIDQDRDE